MWNEEALQKLNFFKELLEAAKEQGGPPKVGYYDVEWLVNTLTWMNERYEEHVYCCVSPCTSAQEIEKLQLEIDQLKGKA